MTDADKLIEGLVDAIDSINDNIKEIVKWQSTMLTVCAKTTVVLEDNQKRIILMETQQNNLMKRISLLEDTIINEPVEDPSERAH